MILNEWMNVILKCTSKPDFVSASYTSFPSVSLYFYKDLYIFTFIIVQLDYYTHWQKASWVWHHNLLNSWLLYLCQKVNWNNIINENWNVLIQFLIYWEKNYKKLVYFNKCIRFFKKNIKIPKPMLSLVHIYAMV